MAGKTSADGLSQEERDAVKDRAKELRAQAKAGKNREAGTKAVLDAIGKLDGTDRKLGDALHKLVSEVAPDLVPKTFYGFPAYANAAGKVVIFLQPASKFKTRYATINFDETANLDDGDVWPTSFAVLDWTPAIEEKFTALVRQAVS
ncbi:uncharacterized protein YdhG (YjbR/CyaY superfamily) [Microbacterium terrae]|uniref:YdhG-like domain-containing protein n=1 Tax=Microbacterium terrae TaxID=69369 RepID=A0A0M2H7W0_9MICO|nr:hypothetical protein [Microbacterium terrae]KJL42605.1 hypothetical protein RS81_01106 [Microbacterium terrae]MBP1079034.1 uncharacterized protein YdhG (YjbR/CyaY superfamily) [Microbacterium terrae]GLJ98434.1 hypothetical protein GCM10017594_16310 [Microbacterium terrae]